MGKGPYVVVFNVHLDFRGALLRGSRLRTRQARTGDGANATRRGASNHAKYYSLRYRQPIPSDAQQCTLDSTTARCNRRPGETDCAMNVQKSNLLNAAARVAPRHQIFRAFDGDCVRRALVRRSPSEAIPVNLGKEVRVSITVRLIRPGLAVAVALALAIALALAPTIVSSALNATVALVPDATVALAPAAQQLCKHPQRSPSPSSL
ncbi:hypothetical protein BD626DRAFT_635039 [Schizophyllum amplum]|uniref:Uncharacterized protein n=1 Tax=Schizophyllum amplum TaxID=97359 RepID=A0A550BXM5_9AGAR|nr:hypothetical protein BD626DRAFT_635039 [Auriculariopsis ampla]